MLNRKGGASKYRSYNNFAPTARVNGIFKLTAKAVYNNTAPTERGFVLFEFLQ